MKTIAQISLVVTLATTISGASAQRVIIGRGHPVVTQSSGPNMKGLAALQKDLVSAIGSMEQALPIYDGYRVKAIRKAQQALIVVDRAMMGMSAKGRPLSMAKDTVGSKMAKGKYSAQQITASQEMMRTGLQYLNTATADLQIAANGNLQKRGQRVAADLQAAIADANRAVNLHSGQG